METYQTAKEEIKRAANIVELIGQYVQLKKAGQKYLGLCPFHSEKDPSFTVSPERQMFHCFGCKKGGDIFNFWMEYHQTSFPQAMRDLAEKYHVILPQRELTAFQRKNKELEESLIEINGMAADYFHRILTSSEKGRPGLEYLTKRSLNKDIIDDFIIGYAPAEWGSLTEYLLKKRVHMDRAVQAGLVIPKKGNGYYDRFRGRVIFPIHNLRKQVVGFGGRVLDGSLPKYVNTPESPVFHKGELLYGLSEAYPFIKKAGRAVIVEGYTDVLALKRHGFHESVATLGTALTKDHIRRLKGYTKEAIVVFDSDTAGQIATIRSFPLFLNEGLSSKVMVLPEGDDPDTFINKKGLSTFLKYLDNSTPMFEFYLNLKLSQIIEGVEGQFRLLEEIIPILSDLKSETLRKLYVKRLSEKSGIAESIILDELRHFRAALSVKDNEREVGKRLAGSKAKNWDDDYLLSLVAHSPHIIRRLIENDCQILLSDPIVKEIFSALNTIYNRDREMIPSEILERLDGESLKERFREAMLDSPFFSDDSIEQALNDFEERVQRIKLSKSLKSKGSTLEENNQILMSIRDMEAREL